MAADLPLMTLDEAQRLFERPGIHQSAPATNGSAASGNSVIEARNEAQKARAQAVADTALGLGVRAGLAWQLRNVEAAVGSMSRDLDSIYNFSPLMIQGRVVPAVITEARDLYNQEGEYALRLSGARYEIVRQARFSSVAPSWREYLTFPKPVVDRGSLASLLMPSTEEERAVWRLAVSNGWRQGVEQANLMLVHGMDRLNRDFAGIARFHRFVVEGKLTLPAIAVEDIPVTRAGQVMAVDETLLRITTLPDFDSRLQGWRGIVRSAGQPVADTASPQ